MKVSPARALITTVVTLGYLGLAALGAGGIRAFLARPQFVALALMMLALMAIALFTVGGFIRRKNEGPGRRRQLAAYAVIALLGGYFPAYTDRVGFLTLDGDTLRWFGVLLFAAGAVLRVVPIFILGRRFSGLAATLPGPTLITTGIYGTIRHPSYLAC